MDVQYSIWTTAQHKMIMIKRNVQDGLKWHTFYRPTLKLNQIPGGAKNVQNICTRYSAEWWK